MRSLPNNCIDAIVCDPPYELNFMGRKWDNSGVAFDPETWREASRVLKPGGYLLAFGHPRLIHRMNVAIEDVDMIIRDTIHWLYLNGTPKSVNVDLVLDMLHGMVDQREVVGKSALHSRGQADGYMAHPGHASPVEGFTTDDLDRTKPASEEAKQWEGWGTGLKTAIEPITLARNPIEKAPEWPGLGRTPAGWALVHNIRKWGVGGLNIDGCRIPYEPVEPPWPTRAPGDNDAPPRWPANVKYCPKPSREEREAGCEALPAADRSEITGRKEGSKGINNFRAGRRALSKGRNGGKDIRNTHVTVKPIELMRWLIRLITPKDGIVLDPFMGSGTTGCAALLEGVRFVGCELEAEAFRIAEARLAHWSKVADEEQWIRQYGSIEGLL